MFKFWFDKYTIPTWLDIVFAVLFAVIFAGMFVSGAEAKGLDKPQTYSASRAGKSLQNQQAQQSLGNTYDQKCVYCYKDLSTEYTPSARKYGKTQQ